MTQPLATPHTLPTSTPLTSDERDHLERQLRQAERLAADLRAVLADGWPNPEDVPEAVEVGAGYVTAGPVPHLVGSAHDPDLGLWTRGTHGTVVASRPDSPLMRTLRGWHLLVRHPRQEESRGTGDSSP